MPATCRDWEREGTPTEPQSTERGRIHTVSRLPFTATQVTAEDAFPDKAGLARVVALYQESGPALVPRREHTESVWD